MSSSSPDRIPKFQLTAEQPLVVHQQENVGSHQKKILHFQGQRRRHSKTVGGAKSCLESNPIPARNTQRAQTNLVSTKNQRPHRDTTGQQRTATGAGDLGAVGLRVA